jgi:hypothetical protein
VPGAVPWMPPCCATSSVHRSGSAETLTVGVPHFQLSFIKVHGIADRVYIGATFDPINLSEVNQWIRFHIDLHLRNNTVTWNFFTNAYNLK